MHQRGGGPLLAEWVGILARAWNLPVASDVTLPMDIDAHDRVATYAPAEHPGVLLRDHVLPGLHLSVSQAARDLAVTRQTLHRILAGNAAISTEMAARLEKFCGVPSEFWLQCQQRCELQRAKIDLALALRSIPSRPLPEAIIKKLRGTHGS